MSTTASLSNPAARQGIRTFYTLILTQTLSMIGSSVTSLAIGIWVFNQTGNATPLAMVSFFAAIPMTIAASVSGVLADRWDRRYVMAVADAGQAASTCVLLASFVTGSFQLWHLYAVTLVSSVFGAFQRPAFQASVTMLVPDEQRDRANAIQQITGPTAGMIGPVIAGFTFALIGVTGAIAIDLATFVIALTVVLSVRIPRPEQTEEGRASRASVWRESLGGLRFLWSRRTLFGLLLYSSAVNFLVVGVMAILTPYILTRTGSEEELGVILSLLNLGAIAGGVIIGAWGGTRPRIHTIMPALMVVGTALMLMGMAQNTLFLAATAFVLLLPLPFVNAPFFSLMQAKTPPDLQGRVFAVLDQIAMLLTPIAYLLVGPLADHVFEPAVGQAWWGRVAPLVGAEAGAGMGLMYALAGGVTVLLTVLVYAVPAVRRLEAELPDYVPAEQA